MWYMCCSGKGKTIEIENTSIVAEDGKGLTVVGRDWPFIVMEFWGVIEMYHILIVMIEAWLCTFVKFIGLYTQRRKFYYMQITPQ